MASKTNGNAPMVFGGADSKLAFSVKIQKSNPMASIKTSLLKKD